MTHTRPSQVLKIDDEFAAYQFDRAVLVAGRWIEAELAKGKKIADLLADRAVSGYKPLAGQVTQKVKQLPWA